MPRNDTKRVRKSTFFTLFTMRKVLDEITALEPLDMFYVGERHKTYFDYPAHQHAEFELNFVENAPGAKRVIGDSVETLGELDLVLMTGPKLVHVWEQGTCNSEDIHEITIHIEPDVFPQEMLNKRPFVGIHDMLLKAQRGLAFSSKTIRNVRADIQALTKDNRSFDAAARFFHMMYKLSLDDEAKVLSSDSSETQSNLHEDRRVSVIRKYIAKHYAEQITMEQLARLTGMTPEGLTRFFHQRTGKTPSRFIIDYRIGIAAQLLQTTEKPISEISFSCGFNTLSHFNRLFKEAKGCTPREFRERF